MRSRFAGALVRSLRQARAGENCDSRQHDDTLYRA